MIQDVNFKECNQRRPRINNNSIHFGAGAAATTVNGMELLLPLALL